MVLKKDMDYLIKIYKLNAALLKSKIKTLIAYIRIISLLYTTIQYLYLALYN